jgi:hypothetical protein
MDYAREFSANVTDMALSVSTRGSSVAEDHSSTGIPSPTRKSLSGHKSTADL